MVFILVRAFNLINMIVSVLLPNEKYYTIMNCVEFVDLIFTLNHSVKSKLTRQVTI